MLEGLGFNASLPFKPSNKGQYRYIGHFHIPITVLRHRTVVLCCGAAAWLSTPTDTTPLKHSVPWWLWGSLSILHNWKGKRSKEIRTNPHLSGWLTSVCQPALFSLRMINGQVFCPCTEMQSFTQAAYKVHPMTIEGVSAARKTGREAKKQL